MRSSYFLEIANALGLRHSGEWVPVNCMQIGWGMVRWWMVVAFSAIWYNWSTFPARTMACEYFSDPLVLPCFRFVCPALSKDMVTGAQKGSVTNYEHIASYSANVPFLFILTFAHVVRPIWHSQVWIPVGASSILWHTITVTINCIEAMTICSL